MNTHQAAANGHDVHDDADTSGLTLRTYLIGFVLAAILTAIPFWIVMTGAIPAAGTARAVIIVFAIAQIIDLPFFLIPGNTYRVIGYQLNGISQGQAFGDEIQAPTNYPLVRLTGSGGDVHYARTHDHSSMGVQTGFSNTVWTWFDVPADMQAGTYRIETVANGVPSNHTCIRVLSAHAIFADPFELCAPL